MGIACLFALAALLAGCTSQVFAQKTPDGQVYLNSSTSFLIFSSTDIKKCTESGTTLTCKKMTIVDGDDSSDDDAKPRAKKRSRDDDSDEEEPRKKHDSDDSDDDSKKSSDSSDDE